LFAECEHASAVIARSTCDEAIQFLLRGFWIVSLIGRRLAPTRWLAMTVEAMTFLQLRPIARLDFGLRLRLAKCRLIVDDLADARQHRALDLDVR
jgi:hypothetical protein